MENMDLAEFMADAGPFSPQTEYSMDDIDMSILNMIGSPSQDAFLLGSVGGIGDPDSTN